MEGDYDIESNTPMLALYTSRSNNVKTGDIPQQTIGTDQTECRTSCTGCPLLDPAKGEASCYAQHGTPLMGAWAIWRSHAKGKDYSLSAALKKRAKTARFVRFGMIGDPSGVDKAEIDNDIEQIRSEGLGVLGYTHFWNSRGKHLKGKLMASCDNWKQVKQAVKQGWRAALHVPDIEGNKGVKDGVKWVKCPYQSHGTNCNDCGLCDATRAPKIDLVVFVEH